MSFKIYHLSEKAEENLNCILRSKTINTKTKAIDFALSEHHKIAKLEDEISSLKNKIRTLEWNQSNLSDAIKTFISFSEE